MKKALPYLLAEVLLSAAIALFENKRFNSDYLTVFGLVNFILGVVGLIFGVIFSIAKQENVSKGLLISSSLLILMGFLTCSIFQIRLN
ncbi:MAG TPA: hypothetical protein VGG71_12850 [Chitinophagaceae bacterium]